MQEKNTSAPYPVEATEDPCEETSEGRVTRRHFQARPPRTAVEVEVQYGEGVEVLLGSLLFYRTCTGYR